MTTNNAAAMATTTTTTTTPELNLRRHFNAERSRVFDALTNPEKLARWFGPEGCTCPDAQSDARVGGTYRLPIVGTDCGTPTVVGDYLVVEPPERLEMTWAWIQEDGAPGDRMVVTFTLTEKDGGTDLELHQVDFIDEDIRDKHAFGWTSSFESLEELLAGAA
ncbi:MAG: SRPBCC domain-containing protein [Alphaproteobacteria bacterium]|nr:SRPBCC domain-containing protein [Alphaproteobacteria bacterium]